MYLRMTTKPTGLIVGLIAIFLILFGALMIANSNWKPFYLNEGFTSDEALRSTEETIASPMEYPTDPLTEIQNPLMKIVKKLGGMSMYFANPQVWVDVYRTSKMSPTELARLNIKKEREAAAATASTASTASDKK